MIIFEMESPSIIGGIFYILFSVCAFLAIIYSLYKSVDYIKQRCGPYKAYLFIAIVFFVALIWLPIAGVVSFKTENDIWNSYSEKDYKEYSGKFSSMKYGTRGVRLFLDAKSVMVLFSGVVTMLAIINLKPNGQISLIHGPSDYRMDWMQDELH